MHDGDDELISKIAKQLVQKINRNKHLIQQDHIFNRKIQDDLVAQPTEGAIGKFKMAYYFTHFCTVYLLSYVHA